MCISVLDSLISMAGGGCAFYDELNIKCCDSSGFFSGDHMRQLGSFSRHKNHISVSWQSIENGDMEIECLLEQLKKT